MARTGGRSSQAGPRGIGSETPVLAGLVPKIVAKSSLGRVGVVHG
jgi:hypothetical protein